MILPKGTVESTRQGGEGKVKEIITELVRSKFTGYMLLQGQKENDGGAKEPVIGQLVVKEGRPILCESIVDKTSEKGDSGTFTFLSVMMDPQTKIEVHSKIDVGPPYAFFKECRMSETIDIDGFLKAFRKRQEDLKRRNQERTEQEKRRKQMVKDLEEWSSSGYQIGNLDGLKIASYQDLVECYNGISQRIKRSREIMKWSSTITDVDMSAQVEKLKAMSMKIDDMQAMEAAVKDIRSMVELINEKRQGIMKWVNLWKEEGYSTGFVEEKLNGPLEAAWDATIYFMDSIQKLKEFREELDGLSKADGAKGFSKEIAEIEFILNDPNEIPNAERLLKELRTRMDDERVQKTAIMNDAQMDKAKGFAIKGLVECFDERLEAFKRRYGVFKNNIERIGEISGTLSKMDRRDLSAEIDALKGKMKDPFKLDSYESTLNEIEERIRIISEERSSARKRIDDLRSQGYDLSSVSDLLSGPIEPLRKGMADIEVQITKLEDIARELGSLDRRWQDDRVAELGKLLKDPGKVADARDLLLRIKARIAEREQLRDKVRHDLNRWRSEGFLVKGLEDVIEEDQSAFSMVHEDLKKRITSSREIRKELESVNAKFFAGESDELKSLLRDPFSLDRAKQILSELKAKVAFDTQRRSDLKKKVEELKRSGFKTECVKDILETPVASLDRRISELDETVSTLKKGISEIDGWDPLERSWLQAGIEELKKHLMDIGDPKGALAHFSQLKERIVKNSIERQEMRDRVKVWKEAGYIVSPLEKKMDRSLDELKQFFQETYEQVVKLEDLQERFDTLDVTHFKKEAEDLEFKMNDPGSVKEIESELDSLEAMVASDREKRSALARKIDSLLESGFTSAANLREFLDRDISILELEIKNFEKETQMFLRYMETTGFKARSEPAAEKRPSSGRTGIWGPALDPARTFSSLRVGNSNRFAVKAGESVVQKPGASYNPLCIIGGPGLGKTHLMNAIGVAIREKHPKMNVVSASSSIYASNLHRSESDGGMEDFRRHYGGADVLLIDDVDELSGDESSIAEIDRTMEDMLKAGKQVVISSTVPPHKLKSMPEKLRTMMDSGLIVEIKMPSDDIKKGFIMDAARKLGIDLPESAVDKLCSIVETDIRTLESFLRRLKAHSEMEGARIVPEMVEEILSEMHLRPEAAGDGQAGPVSAAKEVKDGAATSSFVCDACNSEVPNDSATCPKCGASFEEAAYQCPKCGAEVPAGTTKCPGCKTEFAV